MRKKPDKITLCLDLFFKGISTRQVQSHLQAFYPHNSSHKTTYLWVVKYSNLISNYTDNLKLNVGKELQIDKMEIGSRKSRYRGWFIDSIDTDTRYMVSSEFTKKRDLKALKLELKSLSEEQLKEYIPFRTEVFQCLISYLENHLPNSPHLPEMKKSLSYLETL